MMFTAYATHIGLDASQGTALLAVLSSANFVGRLVAGYVKGNILMKEQAYLIMTFI